MFRWCLIHVKRTLFKSQNVLREASKSRSTLSEWIIGQWKDSAQQVSGSFLSTPVWMQPSVFTHEWVNWKHQLPVSISGKRLSMEGAVSEITLSYSDVEYILYLSMSFFTALSYPSFLLPILYPFYTFCKHGITVSAPLMLCNCGEQHTADDSHWTMTVASGNRKSINHDCWRDFVNIPHRVK